MPAEPGSSSSVPGGGTPSRNNFWQLTKAQVSGLVPSGLGIPLAFAAMGADGSNHRHLLVKAQLRAGAIEQVTAGSTGAQLSEVPRLRRAVVDRD